MDKCPISCGAHHPHQRPTLKNPKNPVNPDSKPIITENTTLKHQHQHNDYGKYHTETPTPTIPPTTSFSIAPLHPDIGQLK